jgi:4,5-dihydroxyphthalate decarboxylase
VRVNQIPPTTNMGEMLIRGELDGSLHYLAENNLVDRSTVDVSGVTRTLFPDPAAEGRRFYAKTGLFPINHTVVVRRSLLESHPWIALNLYSAFVAAKEEIARAGKSYLQWYFESGLLDGAVKRTLAEHDPLAYGFKAARPVLETVAQYVHEQGLSARKVELKEIFAPSTLDV